MTHQALWQAIKLVAFEHNLTCSGLAKKCGLDPTTFNNSKLISKSGTPRWPSCYTITKMLNTLNMTLADFADTYSHAQHILDKKAEKQGYILEGIQRERKLWPDGSVHSTAMFGKLKSEYGH